MKDDVTYDLAIVGGGLAGLALSIQVARQGYRVILFEKEKYPFHRVCGEYISLESWDFLKRLGVELDKENVSRIRRLLLSDTAGKSIEQTLPLGGFGISRYRLDAVMAQLAQESGVEVREKTRVTNVQFIQDEFTITCPLRKFQARVVAGCYGKRSNLDVKWQRPFIVAKKNKLNNNIAVKYHIRYPFPDDLIALHVFRNGYCGISKIEDDRYCLCYLTTAENLRACQNDLHTLEQRVLSENPNLAAIFSGSEKLYGPVVISQVSFDRKSIIEDHVLMLGDTAGMITPLCGNGMSMALHSSKIAADEVNQFINGSGSREQLEKNYRVRWAKNFETRLRIGRLLQSVFNNQRLMNGALWLGQIFPGFVKPLIRQTHGQSF